MTITSPAHGLLTGEFAARPGQLSYGSAIGVLMLECAIPFIPGDVGNASSYDFPVLYELVPGATGDAVAARQDPALAPAFAAAARRLEQHGVRAITGNCAYMSIYQDAVVEAVDVPVFLSSLLQVPLVLGMLPPRRRLAVLVASGAGVNDALLLPAGIAGAVRERCVFRGMEDKEHFSSTFLHETGLLDAAAVEQEMVATAQELLAEHPDIGAFVLECSDMGPYSASVQRATGLPVFDYIGFINWMHHAVAREPYRGVA